MLPDDGAHEPEATSPGTPPRRRTIYLLSAVALFMTVGLAFKTRTRFLRSPPVWTGATQWYEDLLTAVWWASVAVACFLYLRYRTRLERLGITATPRPWHLRHEVRAVVYLMAGMLLLKLPIYVCHIIVVGHDRSAPSYANDLMGLVPFVVIVCVFAGGVIVFVERRHATRERWRFEKRCPWCGYDLRASPKQCPECGAPPAGAAGRR